VHHQVTLAMVRTSITRAVIAAAVVAGTPEVARADCFITTEGVAFGIYDVFATSPNDSIGTVRYRCNSRANVTIELDRGSAPTFATRRMSRGPERLFFNLFTDAARTRVWGNGTGGTGVYRRVNVPLNQNINLPVFGRIPAGQDVRGGQYAETITAIINF
jgi:spore coat protein U-like protein